MVASGWARNDFERVKIQLAIAFVSGENQRFADGPVKLGTSNEQHDTAREMVGGHALLLAALLLSEWLRAACIPPPEVVFTDGLLPRMLDRPYACAPANRLLFLDMLRPFPY